MKSKNRFLTMCIMGMILVLASACGKKENATKVQIAFKDFMEGFKNRDSKKIKEHSITDEEDFFDFASIEKEEDEITKMVTNKILNVEYKLINEISDTKKAILEVEVKHVDLQKYMTEVSEEIIKLSDEEKAKNKFKELINDDKFRVTDKSKVHLVSKDGKWLVDLKNKDNAPFLKTLLGGGVMIGS